jgi:tRNA G10  N-methylase Trm11
VTAVAHPARFSDALVPVLTAQLQPGLLVLDPFAGTGRIHEVGALAGCETVGVELEPEWASMHPATVNGTALALPFADATFDAIVTSPTYGNRMADHHDARDASRRITYTHVLGRPLSPDNSGAMQWGPEYRRFHDKAWREAVRVLKPGGRFVLNIKDHRRAGRPQGVPAWHLGNLTDIHGLEYVDTTSVDCPGMRYGANLHPDDDLPELVVAFTKPTKEEPTQ